jgi:transcriptional regulator GlxA family with amidase domain
VRLAHLLWAAAGLGSIALAGCGVWILSLQSTASPAVPPPVPPAETEAMLAALRPPKRPRPLVAMIGINDATETTDYLMPVGILRRANVADVVMLATGPGAVRLYPALTVEPDATIAEFDAQHPDGADYVIVPAMSRDDDPVALDWLRRQAGKGATIIGVCAGAKVVAAAGLLEGRRATTHWYYRGEMLSRSPGITYVANRRIVVDGHVATTTGITASMPMMLTLIEAIAGRDRAHAVARQLGVTSWDLRHDSGAFTLTRPFALTVLGNVLAFWRREQLGIALSPGMDEVSLALAADAWSRTYRSRAATFAAAGPVQTRHGVRVVPDRRTATWPAARLLPAVANRLPAPTLDETLAAIRRRYGTRTSAAVAMQLEYPGQQGVAGGSAIHPAPPTFGVSSSAATTSRTALARAPSWSTALDPTH